MVAAAGAKLCLGGGGAQEAGAAPASSPCCSQDSVDVSAPTATQELGLLVKSALLGAWTLVEKGWPRPHSPWDPAGSFLGRHYLLGSFTQSNGVYAVHWSSMQL